MYYWLLDTNFKIVAGIDKFQSMIWTEKYYDIGDFELYLPATEESVKLYTEAAEKHYYIIRSVDAKETLTDLQAMIIEEVKTDLYAKNGNFIIVKGSQLKNLLYRRCAIEKDISGNVQTVLRDLILNNVINPSDPDRQIPRIRLGDEISGINDIINYTLNGEYLSKICQMICKENDLGWDILLDYYNSEMKFVLNKGVERTQSQAGDVSTWNSPVVFSIKNQNLIRTTYDLDYENYRNIAIVRHEYEEYNKQTKQVDTIDNTRSVRSYKVDRRPIGLDRYELFLSENTTKIETTEDQVNLAVVNDSLDYKGRTELEKYRKKISVTGEIESNVVFKYGRHYFLGDTVSLRNEYNQVMDARITAVTISLTYNKNSTVPTFEIYNYLGKEEEDEDKLEDKNLRCGIMQDGSLVYRCATDGTLRKKAEGHKYSTRISADGRERVGIIIQNGNRVEVARHGTKSELYDDDKYSPYYQGG